jgi:hypothetical protein
MYKILWHTRYDEFPMTEGISRYPSRDAADKQVHIWQQLFLGNTYFVEPV